MHEHCGVADKGVDTVDCDRLAVLQIVPHDYAAWCSMYAKLALRRHALSLIRSPTTVLLF